MTTYLPSVKWPTLSKRSHSSSLQATDAQLHELPEHEAEALLQLQAATRGTIEASKPKLPECDPWVSLNDEQQSSMRDEILLRFLRYNALSVEKAQHQMETALKWRADFRVASLSTDVVHGAEVGIPITFLSTNKETDDALLLCLAESYVRREVNHAKQETGAAKLFDYMLYDVNGPRARRGSLVVDCTNLSYRNVDVVALKNGIFLYLNYFPDIFNKILIINYPKFMHGVWRAVYPLLDARTRSRVVWITDGKELREQLIPTFGVELLPDWMGGDNKTGAMTLYNGSTFNPAQLVDRFA